MRVRAAGVARQACRSAPLVRHGAQATMARSTIGSCSTSSAPAARPLHVSARREHGAAPTVKLEPIPDVSMEDTFDITIIGGGPAGLAFACGLPELALRDARILLLEGGSLDPVRQWDHAGEWSNRVSSLTAENVGWLEQMGAWEHVAHARSWPVEDMFVWTAPASSSSSSASAARADPAIHFPPLDHPMARMTENVNLQRGLLLAVEGAAGTGASSSAHARVQIREGARVQEMRMGDGGGWVALNVGGTWVRSRLVVGADGPMSPVRQFAQIESIGHAYPTHAVVATLRHAPPVPYANHTAFQRFLATGPLAFLPLAPDAATMVWSTTPALAEAYKRLAPDALARLVNAGFAESEATLARLDRLILGADGQADAPMSAASIDAALAAANAAAVPDVAGGSGAELAPPPVLSIPPASIASFPLRLSHAETYVAPRLALIGDAAHTTHPLAGQGLNMGLADARALAATLGHARAVGADLGSATALAPYPRARYGANHTLLGAIDALDWVFKARGPAVNWARATGLDVINELGWVKNALMRNAGAGAAGASWDRRWGRARADERVDAASSGWPAAAAGTLESWIQLKGMVGLAAEVAGAGVKNGLRRAAAALDKR